MKYIALLGFGNVCRGVAALLSENAATIKKAVGDDVSIKYILKRSPIVGEYAKAYTDSIDTIINDGNISCVCEAIGGAKDAYIYTKKLLSAGISVATSNKELVSVHGVELMELAKRNGAEYLIEATVGSGIPIIKPMRDSFSGETVTGVSGILNGTTNFILTKMLSEGASFDEALSEAQRLGYAEADPSDDIEGRDAARKIAILSAMAFGELPSPDSIYTEGISRITAKDVADAAKLGGIIKLIARAYKEGGKLYVFVTPRVVPKTQIIANVNGVYNGICVTANGCGDVTFCGAGAGSYSAGGGMISDVCDILSGKRAASPDWKNARSVAKPDAIKDAFMVRFKKNCAGGEFGDKQKELAERILDCKFFGEFSALTGIKTAEKLKTGFSKLEKDGIYPESVIRADV
ncbi:MAG: homoserine dehydrogenase [Clostridia bacterium]|nr:homoserine dehydrogenase [Clostridia bacterium]